MVDSGSKFSDRMWLKMEIVEGSGVGSWCVRSSGAGNCSFHELDPS